MAKALLQHGPSKPIHFYCSSGGNAGLACVTAANILQRPATIVVSEMTSAFMVQKLKLLGANVVQIGKHFQEADTYLRETLLARDENAVYVHPFDHKDVWEGHSSMIDELEEQMKAVGGYDAVVCSVGGGGLFSGIMQGLGRNGRLGEGDSGRGNARPVQVLAVETIGADSLHASIVKGELTRIPGITSIAVSLGATQVAKQAFEWAQRQEVISHTLSDANAAMACVFFADDERIMVESACGAALSTAYDGLKTILYPQMSDEEYAKKNVVLVVCGGSGVTLQILEKYRIEYGGEGTDL